MTTQAATLEPRAEAVPTRLWRWVAPATVLAAYAVLLLIGVTHHEPWADEAQSWQLARSLPLWKLLSHQLRYEGHPGLWYVFLALLNHLHVSYTGMRWATAAVAFASTMLLVLRAPFPAAIRYALAFTFFISFEYAIVARSYSLAPLLFFALALSWRRRSAIVPALLLGLLANLALHCFAASIGFAMVYAIEVRRGRQVERLALAGCLLVLFYAAAVLTVLPRPADVLRGGDPGAVGTWLMRCAGYILALANPWQFGLPLMVGLLWAVWRCGRMIYFLPVITLAMFGGYFFSFWHIGILQLTCITLTWIAWPLHMRSRAALVGAQVGVVAFLALHFAWAAHAFVYDFKQPFSPDVAAAQFLQPYVEAGVPMAVTYVKSEDPNKDAHPLEVELMGYYHSIGLAPYFSQPLFLNQPLPYWTWNKRDHTDVQLDAVISTRPPLVVATYYDHEHKPFDPTVDLQRPRVKYLTQRGYRLTHVFCGAKPEDMTEPDHICDLIFEQPKGN